jgi:hypothetical protein
VTTIEGVGRSTTLAGCTAMFAGAQHVKHWPTVTAAQGAAMTSRVEVPPWPPRK